MVSQFTLGCSAMSSWLSTAWAGLFWGSDRRGYDAYASGHGTLGFVGLAKLAVPAILLIFDTHATRYAPVYYTKTYIEVRKRKKI